MIIHFEVNFTKKKCEKILSTIGKVLINFCFFFKGIIITSEMCYETIRFPVKLKFILLRNEYLMLMYKDFLIACITICIM